MRSFFTVLLSILCLALVFALVSCTAQQASVAIKNTTISVELAKTQEELQKGLMYRESLPEGEGMLFLFSNQAERFFWMKNTLIPLDIIFINENKTITKIHQAIPCKEEHCKLYAGSAKYVLELNQGFAAKHDINEGDNVFMAIV